MKIEIDDLSRPAIHALLNEHLQSMYALSPPESVHALDPDRLRRPEITYWTAWEGDLLQGCGALKEIGPTHGEVKSMHAQRASAPRRRPRHPGAHHRGGSVTELRALEPGDGLAAGIQTRPKTL